MNVDGKYTIANHPGLLLGQEYNEKVLPYFTHNLSIHLCR
jgi:hypothetical protein